MGIPTNIKTLLSGNVVEWARIEYKETWDAVASLKTICAFANDLDNWGGGYLVIGVKEEEGRPTYPLQGIATDKIDSYQKDILSKCKLIRPEYMPIIEVVEYQERNFIILWCPGGNTRPYSSPKTMGKDNKERIYYIRKGASAIIPTSEEEKDFIARFFINECFKMDETELIVEDNSIQLHSTPFNSISTSNDLKRQILVMITNNPTISRKKMSQTLGVTMHALIKELQAMKESHIAEFIGYSRSGKWVVYTEEERS